MMVAILFSMAVLLCLESAYLVHRKQFRELLGFLLFWVLALMYALLFAGQALPMSLSQFLISILEGVF